jgi:hypothetical protein
MFPVLTDSPDERIFTSNSIRLDKQYRFILFIKTEVHIIKTEKG